MEQESYKVILFLDNAKCHPETSLKDLIIMIRFSP